MPKRALLAPLAACIVAGTALYVSSGVLDQADAAHGNVRLALLPPWQALIGFVGFMVLGLALLARLNGRVTHVEGVLPMTLGQIVQPLMALAVLALPYAPFLADRWPVLQALAGPLGGLVWLVVAGLQLWVLWQAGVISCDRLARWPRRRVAAAIFIATAALSTALATRLARSALFPGGDEPHYLVMAQSLWRDGDLKIANNHARGDYREYFGAPLEPHYLAAGTDGEIYSVHPVGMPVLMAPVYALGGYEGVVGALILVSALTAALGWWWAATLLEAPGAATFGWIAVAGTAPFLLNTITVYPEMLGGLAVTTAMVLTVGPASSRAGVGRWLAVGAAAAALPWLSTKYAPISAALVLVALGRLGRVRPATIARDVRAWAIVLPYLASLVAWFSFFYAYWGNPLPTAPYGDLVQTSPRNLVFGAPGLLFDQEYGLLALAPVYALAATGLFRMWREGGDLRRQAVEILLVFGALLASVGAFRIWWGGASAPGRPIASGLVLFVVPIAVAFRSAPTGSASRAAQHLLLWVSVGIAMTLAVSQNGFLIDNGRDGTAALLEFWSPRWPLWSLAPTFTFHATPVAAVHALAWVLVAAGAGSVLSRWRAGNAGRAALAAAAVFAAALTTITMVMPMLPSGAPRPAIDLSARSRLAALDRFDSTARPTGVIYDPFRAAAPPDVLPYLSLSVRAGQRTDPQPLRVLLNGRFSVPAGEYDVDVTFADRPSTGSAPIGLQVGRSGPALRTWELEPLPGESWHTGIRLPTDAIFLGFRGPREMEAAISSIALHPTTIVDQGMRPRVPPVLAASAYPTALAFFHDDNVYPESQGFWTIGWRQAVVTLAAAAGRPGPMVLRVHGGGTEAAANFTAPGWQRQVALTPGQVLDIELPEAGTLGLPLRILTSSGFRPKDLDPASNDTRTLGIWVEVVP